MDIPFYNVDRKRKDDTKLENWTLTLKGHQRIKVRAKSSLRDTYLVFNFYSFPLYFAPAWKRKFRELGSYIFSPCICIDIIRIIAKNNSKNIGVVKKWQ